MSLMLKNRPGNLETTYIKNRINKDPLARIFQTLSTASTKLLESSLRFW